MKNIIRIMKKGGVFITDPHSDFNEVIKNDVFEVAKGIFIKR